MTVATTARLRPSEASPAAPAKRQSPAELHSGAHAHPAYRQPRCAAEMPMNAAHAVPRASPETLVIGGSSPYCGRRFPRDSPERERRGREVPARGVRGCPAMTARWSGKCLLWPGLAVAVRDACPTEREGFEPSDEVNPRHTISSRARSAAPAPLRAVEKGTEAYSCQRP